MGHHEGDITSQIVTSYMLFVASEPLATPSKVEQDRTSIAHSSPNTPRSPSPAQTGIDLTLRGEWVITYDVEDAAGNAAEKVQFALILVDTDKPSFTNSPQTTSGTTDYCRNAAECDWGQTGPIRLDGSGTVDIELCGLGDIDTWDLRWTRDAITSTDTYDGDLTETNSQLQHTPSAYSIPQADYYNIACPS